MGTISGVANVLFDPIEASSVANFKWIRRLVHWNVNKSMNRSKWSTLMMIKVHFNAMHNYKPLENNVESLVFFPLKSSFEWVEIENEIEYLYKVNDVRFTMADKVIKTVITVLFRVLWISHFTLHRTFFFVVVIIVAAFYRTTENITTYTYLLYLYCDLNDSSGIPFYLHRVEREEKMVVISHSHCFCPILIRVSIW